MDKKKLKEILKQHKLWLETNGLEGERAELQDANLSWANLSRVNLCDADFRGANLTGAKNLPEYLKEENDDK